MIPARVLGLALGGLLAAGCGRTPAVTITSPSEGETVTGPVRVTLAAQHVEIAPAADVRPGTGHHHLFLDRDPTPAANPIPAGVIDIIHLGRGQTEFTFDSLAPGPHRIVAVLADHGHVPLRRARADTVTFVVGAQP